MRGSRTCAPRTIRRCRAAPHAGRTTCFPTRPRSSSSWPPARCPPGGCARTSARCSARVERLDLGGVLLVDRLALELHRGRQLVAAGQPVALDDVELLDLLHPRELLVGPVDALLDLLRAGVLLRELLQRLALEAVLRGPGGREVRVEDDQRRVV